MYYDEDFDELDFLSDHIHDIKKQFVLKLQAAFALPEVLNELDSYFETMKRHKEEEEKSRNDPDWREPIQKVKMEPQTLQRFRSFADPSSK